MYAFIVCELFTEPERNQIDVKDATLIFAVFKDCSEKMKWAMNIIEESNSAPISFKSGEMIEFLSHFKILKNDIADGFFLF